MSCIEKMTIQGIRSYGPKEKDTQIIEFFTPVTLIIGQNGCGKTTIIECLKYATTSDMPPNTKGSSFLFDPKLIDEVETKGKIKLYFKDTSGLTVQVQKNLCSTQKAKKLEFRTLETLISRYDIDGKLASTITNKCINADSEIVNAFGVSKAVLEHVIFCHQEDSNWPLSDGKLLKTRFDEIFAATKYIKALDTLRKIRLEKNQQIKQMEIEKKHLETYKTRSECLKRNSEENTRELERLISQKKDLGEKLKPIKKQLEFYSQESARIYEIKIELDRIENEKDLIEKQIKELLAATKECLFTGTDAELEEYVEQYRATTDKMRRQEEKQLYEKIEDTKLQKKQISASKSKISLELGALENRFNDYNQNKKKLREISNKASGLIDLDISNTETGVSELTNFINDYEDEICALNEKYKQQEIHFQKKIDTERDKKSKIEQSIQNKTESLSKFQNQFCRIEEELSLVEDDKAQAQLSVKIGQFETDIDHQLGKLINVDEIKTKLKQLDGSKLDLKQKEMEIDSKINKWHLNSKLQTEINMLRNEKKTKQDQIRKIKIHIEEDVENFFVHGENLLTVKSNDSMLKSLFDAESRQLDSDLGSLESNRKELDKNLSSNEFKRKMLNDQYREKEKQLRNYEDTLLNLNDLITNESDIDRFDSILEKLQEEQKNYLDEKGFLSGVDKTYKRFLQQLQLDTDDKHSCPVCMRMFKDMDEVNETIDELKKYTRKIPQKVSDLDEKLKSNGLKLEAMINAKSVKESYENIKHKDLGDLKEKIDEYDKIILPKLRKELTDVDATVKNFLKRKSHAASLQSEVFLIDKYSSEIRDLDRKIENLVKNGGLEQSDDTNLDTLSDQKMIVQSEIEKINLNIKANQEEISNYYTRSDRIHGLKEQLNELKTRRNELESKYQKKSQLIDKREELRTEIESLKKEIFCLEKNLKDCSKLVDDLVMEKEAICQNNEKELAEKKRFKQEINNFLNQMTDLIKKMKIFEQNEESKLVENKNEFKLLDSNEKEMNAKLDKFYHECENIKLEIAKKEIRQRELNDNLMLRQKRLLYEAKKEQYDKKRQELQLNDSVNLKDLKNDEEKLEKKRDQLLKEINEVVSKINILEGKILAVNEELSLDTIKNAMEKYIVCASDLKVLEYSVIDIEKYYKALDRAIMNYHQIKMNEINKIIKQLWRQVYRGIDIDYIEIRSEEENGADEQIKSRKTYNYRVVVIKSDTCLDMRGRCSAGQKVLASIIIRLALAETFGLNSGILALDEPTTNLDRENIESLASALVEIIKTRSKQKNFQLIIITHDEDFVEMLGRSEYMDQFYRVHKDEKGFSRISRRNNQNY